MNVSKKAGYIYTESKAIASGQDLGIYVGERVRCKYNDTVLDGDVIAVEMPTDASIQEEHPLHWTIRFEDGHIGTYDAVKLRDIVCKTAKAGKQIDYALVSARWKSSLTDCRPRWGPSIHRSITGQASDHALLHCTWKWKLRKTRIEKQPDFSALGEIRDIIA